MAGQSRSREVQISKYSLYYNNLQLHVDPQVICNHLWYLMCLSARIRPTLEKWDDAIKGKNVTTTSLNVFDDRPALERWDAAMIMGENADATSLNVSDILVIASSLLLAVR